MNTDLAKEVENFKQAIRNDNGTQKHADLTGLRVTKFIEGCGWRTVNDITLARATEYVAARRTSDGDDHISEGTSNHYMTALSEFCSFLKSTNKLDRNPVEGWKHLPRADRETRRALNHDEQHWLLSVTATSADRRHMTGWEREMVYKTALGRGFRSEELACLTPESFHLQGSTPFVYLPPDETKNSKAANQPITPELAAELREYLEEREPGLPVFPLPETRARSRLVRTDLAATREAWISGDDGADKRKAKVELPQARNPRRLRGLPRPAPHLRDEPGASRSRAKSYNGADETQRHQPDHAAVRPYRAGRPGFRRPRAAARGVQFGVRFGVGG